MSTKIYLTDLEDPVIEFRGSVSAVWRDNALGSSGSYVVVNTDAAELEFFDEEEGESFPIHHAWSLPKDHPKHGHMYYEK